MPSDIDALIVLGNGSPEDEIVGILVWHQKAEKIVRIIKPEKHHVDAFRTVKSSFERLSARRLLFIIDQDRVPLNNLFVNIEQVINEQGIEVTSSQPLADSDRVKVYECMLAGQELQITAVISGLAEFDSPMHVIEDHLVKLAGINSAPNAKEVWNRLDKDKKETILKSLKDRKTAMEAFPQHFTALSSL